MRETADRGLNLHGHRTSTFRELKRMKNEALWSPHIKEDEETNREPEPIACMQGLQVSAREGPIPTKEYKKRPTCETEKVSIQRGGVGSVSRGEIDYFYEWMKRITKRKLEGTKTGKSLWGIRDSYKT